MFSKPLRELLSTEIEVDDAALISIDSKGTDIRVRQGAQVVFIYLICPLLEFIFVCDFFQCISEAFLIQNPSFYLHSSMSNVYHLKVAMRWRHWMRPK